MSQELEIEFKNLLSKDEYQDLFDSYHFSEVKPIIQENYYFDTEDLVLKEQSCSVRIRIVKEQDQAEITLKSPSHNHDHLVETTENIPLAQAQQIMKAGQVILPQSIADQLSQEGLKVSQLSLITWLKTKRFEKNYQDCLLVLDHSWYGQASDYELELEAPSHDKGLDLFYTILLEHNIPQRDKVNKVARAFSQL